MSEVKTALDKERDAAQEAVAPLRKRINENPALLSILYDIDLLPEQIVRYVNANRLVAFVAVFERLTPEAVKSLFQEGSKP